jgi:hypothetical protein
MHLSSELFAHIIQIFYTSFDLLVVVESLHGFEDECVRVHLSSPLQRHVHVPLVVLVLDHCQSVPVELSSDPVLVHLLLDQFRDDQILLDLQTALLL